MTDGLAAIMARWQLTSPENLSKTPIAQLWRVRQANGTLAVLKVYRQASRGNEAAGAALLNAWSKKGAVRIFKDSRSALLMEWLDGPSLGDIARAGDAPRADQLLCDTARCLHHHPVSALPDLCALEEVFVPLLVLGIALDCHPNLRQDMLRATELARQLLAHQPPPVPLHGDLHHDNIILTSSGPQAFDAKGYIGDPAFELANALRHPKGLPALVRNQDRITEVTKRFAEALKVPPLRLAQWAAAKCALSIAYRAKGMLSQDDEADLLALLLAQAGQ
ncbi:aminoglycoside phosphotransferase family protein [Parasedimentitalea psychrophila]|uniref:Aminoglycoside phosphotransferase family protein n=1 Tax=Parasedimentitalea psychrophila TaxID=2997337 RepID=A0A9Y2L0E3_9RHOB|nr:aminoglycoside phosphotransferase family protein [Parasedimentitalea psychrophila]WIY25087.1 aminoglycoside phosphotransferase family protein [Parasedimentitalea psychrophila]